MNALMLATLLSCLAAAAAVAWAILERGRAARSEMRARLLEANAETLAAQAAQSAQAVAEALVQRATESFQAQERVAQARMEEKLKPVAESLAKFQACVTEAEKARAAETGGLKQQLEALLTATAATQAEARKLSTALRRGAGVQGRWGEQMLRNVLELAGLKARIDFEEQVHAETDGGARRPDVVVRLPGGGAFVIDAKCSLNGFLEAQDAAEEGAREAGYQRHAQSVKTHVQSLAAKAYWDQFEASPDFVAMFVPGDAFLAAALERLPDLMTEAMERRVILVTPTTLFALCKAVAYGWRVEKQALNAAETAALGRELYKRLSVMGGHVAGVGKALEAAVGRYNQFVASLETQVLTQARRFEDLASDHEGRRLPEPPTVDVGARPLTKLVAEEPPRATILTVKAPAPTSAA
ncbi:MAG: DNA recombination protein RmuC [Caulobacteraceae bacterium]|nr:DNA recombination protein RmuC [Caulobacteraceae bacterium]